MTTEELLKLDIDSLQKAKFKALKEETIKTLKNFADLINRECFVEAQATLEFSPAGDGTGTDSYYMAVVNMDLYEVCDALLDLKRGLK